MIPSEKGIEFAELWHNVWGESMGMWVVLIKAMLTVGGSAVLCILLGNYLCYPFLWKESLQVWICRPWGQWSDPFSCSCRRGSCIATICVCAPWRCSETVWATGVWEVGLPNGCIRETRESLEETCLAKVLINTYENSCWRRPRRYNASRQRLRGGNSHMIYTLIFCVAGKVRGVAYTVFSV